MLCELSNFFVSTDDLLDLEGVDEWTLKKLYHNKTIGIAYHNLVRLHKYNCLNEDLRLKADEFHKKYLSRTEEYIKQMEYVSELLKAADFSYAILKGGYLIEQVYPIGLRVASDIDILVEEQAVGLCKQLFIENGFFSGHYDGAGRVVPATRKEELRAKLNTGNVLPLFNKECGMIQVDINFSMDFEADNKNIVKKMLKNRQRVSRENEGSFYALDEKDMIVHLCCHLYKDATNYESVIAGYDLRLYEFSDVNMCLERYFSERKEIRELVAKIKEYSLEKECYYAFYFSSLIFRNLRDNPFMRSLLEAIKPDTLEYLDMVEHKTAKKLYRYSVPFPKRIYLEHREEYFEELIEEKN